MAYRVDILLSNKGTISLIYKNLVIVIGSFTFFWVITGCQSNVNFRHPAPNNNKTAKATSLLVTPKMEVLYSNQSKATQRMQLYILHIPSMKTEPLIQSKATLGNNVGNAVFSPDGKSVLFTADDIRDTIDDNQGSGPNEKLDLWIYHRQSHLLRQLTHDAQGYDSFLWSPNGNYIIAEGFGGWTTPSEPPTETGGLYKDLYVWDVKTGKRRLIAKDVNTEGWSPDSKKLFIRTNDWHLYIWDATTYRRLQISNDVDGGAAWAVDGTLLFWNNNNYLGVISKTNTKKELLHDLENYGQACYRQDLHIKHMDMQLLPANFSSLLIESEGVAYWSYDKSQVLLSLWDIQKRMRYHKTQFILGNPLTGKSKNIANLSEYSRFLGWTPDNKAIIIYDYVIGDILRVISTETGAIQQFKIPNETSKIATTMLDWRFAE